MLVSQTETSFNFIFVTYTEGNQKRRWTLPPKAFLVLEVVTLESGKHPALRGMYQGIRVPVDVCKLCKPSEHD